MSSQVGRGTLPATETRFDGLVHGDLHDKNIFAAPNPGIIDLDGIRLGAPEDDLANLAVHLHLRAMQSGRKSSVGKRRKQTLYTAYNKLRRLDGPRLQATERHTYFRLACLYNFRRSSRHLVPELLTHAATVTTTT